MLNRTVLILPGLLSRYGRPPGLPAGVMPPGVVVPGEGALAGALMGLVGGTTGRWPVESAGCAVAGRVPGRRTGRVLVESLVGLPGAAGRRRLG